MMNKRHDIYSDTTTFKLETIKNVLPQVDEDKRRTHLKAEYYSKTLKMKLISCRKDVEKELSTYH